jgi:hypothetical protein
LARSLAGLGVLDVNSDAGLLSQIEAVGAGGALPEIHTGGMTDAEFEARL